MHKEAKNTNKFFKCIGSIHNIQNGEVSTSNRSAYQALTKEEYETVNGGVYSFTVEKLVRLTK